jgi:serine/threonine protein kinase
MNTPDNRVLADRYRLVRQLDEGGMGSVWLAEHLSLSSPVAVKLLAREVADSEEGTQRFLREARTAASLRSPHIVQILDYGVHAHTPFIVMELLEGESLALRLLRRGQLSPVETELVIRHLARAVGRAHEAGITHRDLKPGNVFIVRNDEEEVVKLLDFGIAKAVEGPWNASIASATRTGVFLGTPYYASPEQAEGVKSLDYRTDIWSLGVIAFECLIGQLPFMGDTFASLLLAICSHPLPAPSQYGPVPPGFDAWFARACARKPEARFQSAREAASELRRAIISGAVDSEDLSRGAIAGAISRGPFISRDAPTAILQRDAATSIAPRSPPQGSPLGGSPSVSGSPPGAPPRLASAKVPTRLTPGRSPEPFLVAGPASPWSASDLARTTAAASSSVTRQRSSVRAPGALGRHRNLLLGAGAFVLSILMVLGARKFDARHAEVRRALLPLSAASGGAVAADSTVTAPTGTEGALPQGGGAAAPTQPPAVAPLRPAELAGRSAPGVVGNEEGRATPRPPTVQPVADEPAEPTARSVSKRTRARGTSRERKLPKAPRAGRSAAAKQHRRATPGAAAERDCEPAWYVDDQGVRHNKPDCRP